MGVYQILSLYKQRLQKSKVTLINKNAPILFPKYIIRTVCKLKKNYVKCLPPRIFACHRIILFTSTYILLFQSIKIPLLLAAICNWGTGKSPSTPTFWTASKSLFT